MSSPIVRTLHRASETVRPNLNLFKAIWAQWEADGSVPGEREVYVKAENALKQALRTLGETNIPEFARSNDVRRYAMALGEAIRCVER